jgi:excisionase family DNA binding protein
MGRMNPDPLLTTAEAAELLHTPVGTLRYWRHQGTGPKGFRLGARRVMYRRSDVLAWLEEQYNAEQVKA